MDAPTPRQEGDPLSDLNVLYVEDDPGIREELGEFLMRRVGRLVTARDGHEGLMQFQNQTPDLVITDLRMPGMDGLAMITAIRALSPRVPVVVTTAHNDESYLLRAIELNVDRYLQKPLRPKLVLEALNRLAAEIHGQKQVEAANRYLRFVLESHPNLLLIVRNGQAEYLNPPFLDFLGCDQNSTPFDCEEKLNEAFLVPIFSEKETAPVSWQKTLDHVREKHLPILFLRRPVDNCDEEGQPFLVTWSLCPSENLLLYTFADATTLESQLRDLEKKAYTDPLTGACNRARLQEALKGEIRRTMRHESPLSVLILDLDHFKKVNDTHGHQTGDRVLRELVTQVSRNLRASDLLARWGGEEFVVITPETDADSAQHLAEKLRLLVEHHPFPHGDNLTVSIGVTSFRLGDTRDSLLERADAALYQAKRLGRNQVASVL